MTTASQAGNDFARKVALVTGAAGGIGSCVTDVLAALGARVAAADINVDALQAAVGLTRETARSVTAYKMDVTDSRAVESVVAQIEHELGPVGLLVNGAGILRTGPVADMTDEDWSAIFAVNTLGTFHVSRAVARRMRARNSGSIVTISSNASSVPRLHMGAYCASKAASSAFTKSLGLELAEHGIRCNVVAPGSTDTPMLSSMWTSDYGPDSVISGDGSRYRLGIPLRKLARPRDIADTVAFLLSDRASHITMQELRVDGGATLGA